MRERLSKADETFELQAQSDKNIVKQFRKNCSKGS